MAAADNHDIVSPHHAISSLLPDAEAREDRVQHVLYAHVAGDPAERPHRHPQFLGAQLRQPCTFCRAESGQRLVQRRAMPSPGQGGWTRREPSATERQTPSRVRKALRPLPVRALTSIAPAGAPPPRSDLLATNTPGDPSSPR